MKSKQTLALLVLAVPFGESDIIATFFTEHEGRVSTIVRGARRSTKRFGGALEPIHELTITFDDQSSNMAVLREARISRARLGVLGDLEAMNAAGRALRWVRHLCPLRTPEPRVWAALSMFLDGIDGRGRDSVSLLGMLAKFGFMLLGAVGYAIDFERCVRCGKACPEGRAAFLDVTTYGGLVCLACGGAKQTIDAVLRAHAVRLQSAAGDFGANDSHLSDAHARALVGMAEQAMRAHADFESPARR